MNDFPEPQRESELIEPPPILPTSAPPAGPRPFAGWATFIFVVLALAAFLYRNWPYLTESRIVLFSYPATTAFWTLHHAMQIHEALQRASTARKTALAILGIWDQRIPEDCEQMLRDVLDRLESTKASPGDLDKVRAHLAVLLAEKGYLTNALAEVARLGNLPETAKFRELFLTAYVTNSNPGSVDGAVPKTDLLTGWAHWRLSHRWLTATGETARTDGDSIASSENAVLGRLAAVQVLAVLIQFVGLACVVWLALWKTLPSPVGWGFKSLPWSAGESWGLFVRAMFYGIVLEELVGLVPGIGYYGWLAHCLVFSIPAVVLLAARHWSRDFSTFQMFFGLPTEGLFRLLLAGLGTFAVCWLALAWVPLLTEALGFRPHWADSVDEVLLTHPWFFRLVHIADGIIFGPIMEEIVYRGLLFGALRSRFSAIPAAAISALVFSGGHFYSLPGFLGVAAFGFVCALAREKTGSLLPCIFAHCLTNFLLFGGEVWIIAG